MSITENDRLDLRQALAGVLDERLAEILMTAMPPIDYDRLATKDDLATVESSLRADTAQLRGEFAELRGEFAELRGEFAELRGEFADLKGEVHTEIGKLRGEMGALKGEMGHLRGSLEASMASNLRIIVAAQVGTMLGLASWVAAVG